MIEPRWLKLARIDLGLRETPGIANNPVLMQRFAGLTKALGIAYNADSVPWCGAIMAWWMRQCAVPTPLIAARAKAWAGWGANLRLTHLAPGAVLVFGRIGGGHVALYVGEDATHYHILGGNQSDKVSIVRKAKSDLLAARWPKGEPVLGGPVRLSNFAGVALAGSEA